MNAPHTNDRDCAIAGTVDHMTGHCSGCGVSAGAVCPKCGGERFHFAGCTASDATRRLDGTYGGEQAPTGSVPAADRGRACAACGSYFVHASACPTLCAPGHCPNCADTLRQAAGIIAALMANTPEARWEAQGWLRRYVDQASRADVAALDTVTDDTLDARQIAAIVAGAGVSVSAFWKRAGGQPRALTEARVDEVLGTIARGVD